MSGRLETTDEGVKSILRQRGLLLSFLLPELFWENLDSTLTDLGNTQYLIDL